jgi:hypothetical protein
MKYTIAYNLNAFSNGLHLPSAHIVGLDDVGLLSLNWLFCCRK